MDLDRLHDALLALYPLDSVDDVYSVQLAEVEVVDSELRLTLRVVRWTEVDGKRSVDTIHQQPVVVADRRGTDAQVLEQALRHTFIAQAMLAAHDPAEGFPPYLLTHGLALDWPRRPFPPAGFRIRTGSLDVLVGQYEERGDAWWRSLEVRAGGVGQGDDVLWVGFPEDRDLDRLDAYASAMFGVVWALISRAPSPVVRALPVEAWFAPGLLDEPNHTSVADFVHAWSERFAARGLWALWASGL